MPRSSLKSNKLKIWRIVILAILPTLIVAGLVFGANKIKNLFSKRVQLPAELKLIADLAVLKAGNLDNIRFNKNKFHPVISDPQSIFFKFSSSKFLYSSILQRMINFPQLINLFNNFQTNLFRNSQQFLLSPRLNFNSQHKNYLVRLAAAFTFPQGIQEFSRSASLTLRSVSRIAFGVDHSIKSMMSSNNSLVRTFGGANTPRRFFSSIMVSEDLLDVFAIQNNINMDKKELSNTNE